MRLSRVTIKGFKSFPDKIEIQPRDGITSIVGPNGSGKSNISEAIRWVFGEQARQLRGNEATDVIFKGSERRKAEGMAEVSLTFDNSCGTLPINYREVEVGRRLYRNGNNEYLLNRSVVPLREITTMFAGTGIGTRFYSFIEQNQINELIQARPMARRVVFEEAAGISRYLQQAHDAGNKLRRAEQDIQRLDDIINELARQVRSLRIQAGRAERYLELRAALRHAELVRVAVEAQQLEAGQLRLTEAGCQIAGLITTLREQVQNAEGNLGRVDQQIAAVTQQLRETTGRQQACQARIEQATDQMHGAQREEHDLRERATGAQQRASEHTREQEDMVRRVEEAHRQVEDLAREELIAGQNLEQAERHEQEANSRGEHLVCEAEQLRNAVHELSQARLQAEHECTQQRREHEAVQEQIEHLRERLTAQSGEHARITQNLEQTRQRLGEHHEELSRVEHQREEVNVQLEQLRESIRQQQAEVDQLRQNLSRQRHRYETLEDLARTHDGYVDGVRCLLEQRAQGREPASRIKGVLTEHLRVEAGWEDAIESALAMQVQTLLVTEREDALAVLDHLASADHGRATVAILDALAAGGESGPAVPEHLLQQGWKRAADLVTSQEVPVELLEHLLGRVLIAPDLQSALAEMANVSSAWIVTATSGEVIHAPGVITGGRSGSSGILARQRKLDELRQSIEQCEAEFQTAGARLEESRTKQTEMRAQLDALSTRRHELLICREGANKEIDGQVQLLERLEHETASQQQDLEQLLEQAGNLCVQLEQAQGRLVEQQQELERQKIQRDDANARVAQWQQEQQQHSAATHAAREQQLAVRKDLERLRSDIEHLARRREDLKRLVAVAHSEHEDLLQRAQVAAEHQEQAREILRGAIEELDKIEQQLGDQQVGMRQLEDNRKAAAEQLRRNREEQERQQVREQELQLELREIQVRHQTLLERCREELRATPEDCQEHLTQEETAPNLGQLVESIQEMQEKMMRLGEVNPLAAEEHAREKERLEEMETQRADLLQAQTALEKTMKEAMKASRGRFEETFEAIRQQFQQQFRRLFGGGRADIMLCEADDVMSAGVEIVAQPPGKKPGSISLLSGGEQALTAVALLLSIFQLRPAPFCLLDEVDGPLDDTNAERLMAVLREFVEQSQFVIITHNKLTMRASDAFLGVSMPAHSGVSRIVSLTLSEAESKVVQLRQPERDQAVQAKAGGQD